MTGFVKTPPSFNQYNVVLTGSLHLHHGLRWRCDESDWNTSRIYVFTKDSETPEGEVVSSGARLCCGIFEPAPGTYVNISNWLIRCLIGVKAGWNDYIRWIFKIHLSTNSDEFIRCHFYCLLDISLFNIFDRVVLTLYELTKMKMFYAHEYETNSSKFIVIK